MPDGQNMSWSSLATLHAKALAGNRRALPPVPAAACDAQNARLFAQNILLQSALARQQMQTACLRRILCNMDLPTTSICPALKLRLCTKAASQLLGIAKDQIGMTLVLSGPFALDGQLLARIRTVIETGIAESQVVPLAFRQLILCRMLPLHAFAAAKPHVDEVIV